MPQKPAGLEKFWKELKRRKVISVITIYASASFGIIEIVNNLITPLHLPGSVSTISIIILAVGLPFAIILSWIYDLTGGGFVRTKSLDESDIEEKVKAPNAWKIATYISFAVIIGLVVLNITRGNNIIKPGMIQSLVVLPFDNETGDEKLEYFVSGMHSSLIGDIGKIASLRVISKTSSDVYKDVHKPLPQIASELDVDAVVEAQVMCIGDSICLQVRVVEADRREKLLWVGDYREDRRKILGLYNQVTRQIADEVKVKLSSDEERVLSKSEIVSREAYDAYLKGMFYWRKLTPSDLETALRYFELARQKDPGFAQAYMGISLVWDGRQQTGILAPSEATPKMMEAARKALELDSTSADIHYQMAIINTWTLWDWKKGEQEFRETIRLNPNHVEAHAFYSHLLAMTGRNEEAAREMEIAVKLDPLSAFVNALHGVVLTFNHKYDDAIRAFQDALKIEPFYPLASCNLGNAYFLIGKYKEAQEQFNLYVRDDVGLTQAYSKGYAEAGFKGAQLSYAKVAEMRFKTSYWLPFDIAQVYAICGDKDKAIYWLEQAYTVHDPNTPYLLNPVFDPLRTDPRFQDLCRRMRLPDKP